MSGQVNCLYFAIISSQKSPKVSKFSLNEGLFLTEFSLNEGFFYLSLQKINTNTMIDNSLFAYMEEQLSR